MNGMLAELQRNPRLRLGLLVVVGIVLLNLLLGMQDENRLLRAREAELAQRLSRLGQADASPEWLKRQAAANELLKKEQAMLWVAPSEGRAQAMFQDWVTAQFASAKIPRFNMKLADGGLGFIGQNRDEELPANVKRVRLKVDFDFDPNTNLDWLRLIEEEPRTVQFESLLMRRPRVETVLVAYFRLESKPQEAAPAEDKATYINKDKSQPAGPSSPRSKPQ